LRVSSVIIDTVTSYRIC